MLIAPFLLKGIAALKSIFFLTSGASVSWYSQHMGKRTIGPGLFAVSLALSCALIHTLPYEPPLELGSIPDSPPLDPVLWQSLSDISVEFNMGSDSLVVSNPDVGLSESSTRSYAPGVTPGVQYSVVPLILAPSHEPAVRVPELNWNIPGAPTIQAPKPVEQPAVVTYNFYIVEVSWGSPHRPGDPGTRGPTGSDESIPPLRKYEAPPLMFTRRCGKKAPFRRLEIV
ncbi:uncharacterized protein B0H18DRAFT_423842 [Fomitopsis serialis]|uniref:uncharacterized protein n=1 Tax=Fomitopsis serialis TaxID=139415 RepID=UPI002008B7E1|nr:uncharacterized protein B0H18DRAFT_423842 [Neoantrodia serialis]KAH9935793.1 hypothetical protein B0H18DRAFT_423842 [Neoantrodia serialis]